MKKTILFIALATAMLACQEKQKPTDKTEAVKTDTTNQKADNLPAKTTPTPDYAKLIQGKWVQPEQDGFQPWAAYDAEKVYRDGNEQGTEYQIEGDKLIYRVLGGGEPAEYKIVTLTDKKLTIQLDKDRQETWSRETKKEANKPKTPAINAKLLVGKWLAENPTDEFSAQRIYKANSKVDLTPFNDFANYKVVGNKIKYTNVVNNGQPYEDVITSLTATELVLNGKMKFKRIK